MMRRAWHLAFLLLFLASPAHAETLTAATALSGDTLKLADGRTLRLQGIKAADATSPALAEEAKATLQKLATAKPITLIDPSTDRYGRLTGQAFIADGGKEWLEGEMLKAGLAFVYPPSGNESKLPEMRRMETEARHAHRGIWADKAYADIPADQADAAYGRFAFVNGTIVKAERVKNKVYLNFGADWKKDFTVMIAAHDLRAFKQVKLDPLDLEGKSIRVRGWVIRDFGPMIKVTTPWQIETISAKD